MNPNRRAEKKRVIGEIERGIKKVVKSEVVEWRKEEKAELTERIHNG